MKSFIVETKMNATYHLRSLNDTLAELIESSTRVRIFLGTRSECLTFALQFGLNFQPQ